MSVGRIEKMEFFLGKVKKWKKQSVGVLGEYCCLRVELTKWNFLGKVEKTICKSASADAYLRLKIVKSLGGSYI